MLTTLIDQPFVVVLLVLGAVAGWLLAFRSVERALTDIARFPRSLWPYTGPQRRHHWRMLLIGGYLLGGWPALFVASLWYKAGQRAELLEEVRWRKTRARPGSGSTPSPRSSTTRSPTAPATGAPVTGGEPPT